MEAIIALVQLAACLGGGHAVLRWALGGRTVAWDIHVFVAFALGMGLLGWWMFFLGLAGLFSTWPVILSLAVACMGCVHLIRHRPFQAAVGDAADPGPGVPLLGVLFLAGVGGAVLLFDGSEILTPITDADSLAYHFALPKDFIQAGGIQFVPRAVDGAVPLLIQLTYIAPLMVGGDIGLMLWTGLSGGALCFGLFAIARAFVPWPWATALGLALATTPAIIYGAGNGQVEARTATCVLAAAWLVLKWWQDGGDRLLFAAGLAVGAFVASKYLGLIHAAALGLIILVYARHVRPAAVFSMGVLTLGFQWYLWNWMHTGDPFFPVLYEVLGVTDPRLMDEAHFAAFKTMLKGTEVVYPQNPLWLVLFPFAVTFGAPGILEAGRTGLGPLGILLLPFAALGFWVGRSTPWVRSLGLIAAMAGLSYALLFFIGPSQRIRHFLPLYPLILLVLGVLAIKGSIQLGQVRVLAPALAAVLVIQTGGHAVHAKGRITHLISDEPVEAYLARRVTAFNPIPWINENLPPDAKLYTLERQLIYLINRDTYYAHNIIDTLVDDLPGSFDPRRYRQQLIELGVTHLLVVDPRPSARARGVETDTAGVNQWLALLDAGCARVIKDFDTIRIGSQTLPGRGIGRGRHAVVELDQGPCALD